MGSDPLTRGPVVHGALENLCTNEPGVFPNVALRLPMATVVTLCRKGWLISPTQYFELCYIFSIFMLSMFHFPCILLFVSFSVQFFQFFIFPTSSLSFFLFYFSFRPLFFKIFISPLLRCVPFSFLFCWPCRFQTSTFPPQKSPNQTNVWLFFHVFTVSFLQLVHFLCFRNVPFVPCVL